MFPAHLSSSVHHSMSSFPFISTGKCWSFPCLMELERVVMVRTFPNYKNNKYEVKQVQPRSRFPKRASLFCRFQTFATLPCSRQSCSSSLSIPEAHRGLWKTGGLISIYIHLLLYVRTQDANVFLRFLCPTCSCPAGFPRSIGHGEQQRPRWHQSSPGYTARKHTDKIKINENSRCLDAFTKKVHGRLLQLFLLCSPCNSPPGIVRCPSCH